MDLGESLAPQNVQPFFSIEMQFRKCYPSEANQLAGCLLGFFMMKFRRVGSIFADHDHINVIFYMGFYPLPFLLSCGLEQVLCYIRCQLSVCYSFSLEFK